jgi:hypothetical protein
MEDFPEERKGIDRALYSIDLLSISLSRLEVGYRHLQKDWIEVRVMCEGKHAAAVGSKSDPFARG